MNPEIIKLQKQIDFSSQKVYSLEQRLQHQAQCNMQLQQDSECQAKKIQFQNKIVSQLRTQLQQSEVRYQQLKAKYNKLETQTYIQLKDLGMQPYLLKQLSLEKEINNLNNILHEKDAELQEMQKELKITSNALVFKEEQFFSQNNIQMNNLQMTQMNKSLRNSTVPTTTTQLGTNTQNAVKKSLFRTIAALKQECDLFEKLYNEELSKQQKQKLMLQELKEENMLLNEQMNDYQQRYDQLISENNSIDQREAEILQLKGKVKEQQNQNRINVQLNKELQNNIEKQQDYLVIKQHNEQLRRELQQKDNQIAQQQQQLKNAIYQNSAQVDSVSQSYDNTIQQLKQQIYQYEQQVESLKQDKQKLQKAVLLSAKIRSVPRIDTNTQNVTQFSRNSVYQEQQQYNTYTGLEQLQ